MSENRLQTLQQPQGGLFKASRSIDLDDDEPSIFTRVEDLGKVSRLNLSSSRPQHAMGKEPVIHAAGSGLTREACITPALGEGLERYCTSIFNPGQFILATARELGESALDLDSIPRCSADELAHPKCFLRQPDRDAPIRWVRALSMHTGEEIYVPAVMVYLFAGFISEQERISIPITTGCAAHQSYEQALVSGILEVIERDALSIAWLQKLPLPRLIVDSMDDALSATLDAYRRSARQLAWHLFDATTDLGVPVVYGVQVSPQSQHARTLVCCSASLTPADAVAKCLRDTATGRIPYRWAKPIPQSFDDYRELHHGACFMARPENSGGFDFLLQSPHTRTLTAMTGLPPQGEALPWLLKTLRTHGLDVYAVDLTTDEAMRAGVRVVRAVIPGLQPFSYYYRSRFLAHSRLYAAPRAMGYAARGEADLNQNPQPFA